MTRVIPRIFYVILFLLRIYLHPRISYKQIKICSLDVTVNFRNCQNNVQTIYNA